MITDENDSEKINRREFVNRTASLMALGMAGLSSNANAKGGHFKPPLTIRIKNVDSNFEREPLIPYRFK
ncbi:MAG: L-alanine-DL-glutamate epimerase, partial [Cyclobacteriaceae bacterium]|nr:L-alanine-DL-glutamate epimerase [Cyclobacteriaceae bacterium]